MDEANEALYAELGDLAKKLGSSVTTLQEAEAVAPPGAAAQLPQAAAHLTDVVHLTEQGIHRVMELLEGMQDTRGQALRDLQAVAEALQASEPTEAVRRKVEVILQMLTGEEGRWLDVVTALSFQDLVAQRAQKIVVVLEEVQHKLADLVTANGPQGGNAAITSTAKAQQALDHLEASRSQSLGQDYIDEVLQKRGLP